MSVSQSCGVASRVVASKARPVLMASSIPMAFSGMSAASRAPMQAGVPAPAFAAKVPDTERIFTKYII
jgi:hypothetical protein